jgi:hypothetical protein
MGAGNRLLRSERLSEELKSTTEPASARMLVSLFQGLERLFPNLGRNSVRSSKGWAFALAPRYRRGARPPLQQSPQQRIRLCSTVWRFRSGRRGVLGAMNKAEPCACVLVQGCRTRFSVGGRVDSKHWKNIAGIFQGLGKWIRSVSGALLGLWGDFLFS